MRIDPTTAPHTPSIPFSPQQSLAPQLFAVSLFPYIAFLYYLHKSGQAPKLTLFGFYFLLAFVGATIPAGIYGVCGGGGDDDDVCVCLCVCVRMCVCVFLLKTHICGRDHSSWHAWCVWWWWCVCMCVYVCVVACSL